MNRWMDCMSCVQRCGGGGDDDGSLGRVPRSVSEMQKFKCSNSRQSGPSWSFLPSAEAHCALIVVFSVAVCSREKECSYYRR